jgi:hypothetical protein
MARNINENYKYKDVMEEKVFSYSILPKHSQFRGNMSELGHNKDEKGNESIYLFNSYYTGFSRQRYDISSKTTETTLYYGTLLPKYLQLKMIEMDKWILERTKQKYNSVDQYYIKYNDLTITMNNHAFNIESSSKRDGFKFMNNQHTIEELKGLQELMKKIKKVFKYNSCKDIYRFAYDKSEYIHEHNGNGIYLDFNRFFKLKQVKT